MHRKVDVSAVANVLFDMSHFGTMKSKLPVSYMPNLFQLLTITFQLQVKQNTVIVTYDSRKRGPHVTYPLTYLSSPCVQTGPPRPGRYNALAARGPCLHRGEHVSKGFKASGNSMHRPCTIATSKNKPKKSRAFTGYDFQHRPYDACLLPATPRAHNRIISFQVQHHGHNGKPSIKTNALA